MDSLNTPSSTQHVSHDKLYDIRNNVNSGFSIIHLNARSLAKNIENIGNMLQANGVKFSIIATIEIWLTETHNKEYYNLSGYDAFFTNRRDKKAVVHHYIYAMIYHMSFRKKVHMLLMSVLK